MRTDFMASAKQKAKAMAMVRKTAQKYASLRTEFTQQVKQFRATGKRISRPLVSKLEKARYDYEQAQKRLKRIK